MLDTVKTTVTTTGNAGAAGGTGFSNRPVEGEVAALYVDWNAGAPATSDITVTIESDDDHPAVTLYVKADSAADAWVYPAVQRTGTDGVAIAAEYQNVVGSGRIKVVVAQCDALAPAVTVYVYVKR